ncbi:Oxidoreductase, short-chain dehydrogenase/reductase family [Candidatus Phaeomarinobacter ectocarpi]|uniref:Oxidoreductase, short-chain dehydrogenase/reductase family n=1 Tax=Candidatus Phaeomarinibacter ectocarpi TaxID=1458461 RepID=X5MED2_9HYPH|nr:SDR family NAD(P)-dependent oxidoreductase [Candidatus Phaeomarinobacter ectocarpi]CDO60857.1 Oxidoreductase, short-chain dehydrogenase/reductase family [Candidatus Phaeomarinobacter ectocarpi]
MAGQFENKTVLITGASRGIGYAVALAFAREGAHVIAVARTEGALEELDDAIQSEGGSATLVPLDLTDYEGVDRLGAALFERWGKLDVLIGNAGDLGVISPIGHVQPKDWHKAIDINVNANWRLLRSMDPLLQAADAGRAVFVTSGAAQKCNPFWGPYAVSKAALEALVKTYAAESANTNVRANLLSPGPVRTAMRAKAMPGEDPGTLPHPNDVAGLFLEMSRPDFTENGVTRRFTP